MFASDLSWRLPSLHWRRFRLLFMLVLALPLATLWVALTPLHVAYASSGRAPWWTGDCDNGTNGTLITTDPSLGIQICYPNGWNGLPSGQPNYNEYTPHGVVPLQEWQCVEFSARYLEQVHNMPDKGGINGGQAVASTYYNWYSGPGSGLSLIYGDSTQAFPSVGDVLSTTSGQTSNGHTGVVNYVHIDDPVNGNGYVMIAQQNVTSGGVNAGWTPDGTSIRSAWGDNSWPYTKLVVRNWSYYNDDDGSSYPTTKEANVQILHFGSGSGGGASQRVGELDANGNLLVADGPVGTNFAQAIGPNIKAAAFSNTNLTGVIDGNGNFLVDSGSLNNFKGVLGPGVNNGPIVTAIALSGNVQGALDNSGNLWVANGLGNTFTKVIGPNIQDFALSGTRIGVIDGNGNFLVEDTSQSGGFTALLGPGVSNGPFIKAVALSGTRMGALDSNGNFWVADGPVSTSTTFTKVIGPNIQAITMTDCSVNSTTYDRLGVIDGNGNFLANDGALNASFSVQQSPLMTRIGLYCSRVGALDTNGNGSLKDGALSGSWTQEFSGKQGLILPEASSAIHAPSMRLGAIGTDGYLYVADGPVGKSFTKVIGPNIKAAALSGTRIGVIDGNGNFLVADGPVGTSFSVAIGPSLHSGPVITAIALSGTRMSALDASGNVWAVDGPVGTSPSIVIGPAVGGPTIKAIGLSGSRIGALDTSGTLWVADGAVGITFTKVIGPNIQSFILSGLRIGVIDGNGNFLVNQGMLTASFKQAIGPNIQAIAMNTCQSGPTFNWGVSYNRLGVIDGNGNFLIDDYAVTDSLTSFSLEQQKVVAQIGLYCSRIAMVNPSGNFYAHDGDDTPSWTLEMAGVKTMVLPDAS